MKTHQNNTTVEKKTCTKLSQGKGGEKELCRGCATRVRQYRRKLEFDGEFQFAADFDEKLGDINGKR